ncbi:response regulator transcription factor [Flavobacterium selenitireducens]|uniref:response regulator transcription factor n=1 Tax=Flavobacterium selenitireducens TaxID=2722704 RepID=UPI00168B3F2D|nr:response regulator transcription factor [Flavobacterium selenitireducens]MBD3582577.1 response regulator transcription factor [Flavobacterium selenitireducens]
MPRILYAEDDETLAFLTKDNLEQHGYDVVHCPDGNACFDRFSDQDFDICILDIMMPKRDGFELAADIRKIDANIPIIFLSAKTLKEDRIKGLRLGADDYLIKPFSIEELVLKIEVFLKRSQKSNVAPQFTYEVGRFTFDSHNYALFDGSEKITLTQRESELLQYFLNNRNQVLKREQILKAVWGDDDYFMGRSLDVFISRLRKILANESVTIENLHGIGFKFSDTP